MHDNQYLRKTVVRYYYKNTKRAKEKNIFIHIKKIALSVETNSIFSEKRIQSLTK